MQNYYDAILPFLTPGTSLIRTLSGTKCVVTVTSAATKILASINTLSLLPIVNIDLIHSHMTYIVYG